MISRVVFVNKIIRALEILFYYLLACIVWACTDLALCRFGLFIFGLCRFGPVPIWPCTGLDCTDLSVQFWVIQIWMYRSVRLQHFTTERNRTTKIAQRGIYFIVLGRWSIYFSIVFIGN